MASSVAEQRYQQFKGQGFETYFFIASDASGKEPDAAYCKQVRAQYKLTMPVLYGSPMLLASLGITGPPNDWNLVIEKGGKLYYKKTGPFQDIITGIITQLLAK